MPILAAGFVLMLLPAPARADGIVTPFLGATRGEHHDRRELNFGVSLAALGPGIVGFEADLGYTPDFFGDKQSELSLMGNLLVGRPFGMVRPYGTGGVGLLRSKIGSARINDFGMNIGGGVMAFPGQGRIGVRGDIRYFRELSDTPPGVESLEFWRFTVGAAFIF